MDVCFTYIQLKVQRFLVIFTLVTGFLIIVINTFIFFYLVFEKVPKIGKFNRNSLDLTAKFHFLIQLMDNEVLEPLDWRND